MPKSRIPSNIRYQNGLAQSVQNTFSNWEQNRLTLQDKWDKNNFAYRGVSKGVWKKEEGEDWRSNTFLNITKQKILAAYAIVIDTLMPDGKIPFLLKPAPWESSTFTELGMDIKKMMEDEIQFMHNLIEQQLLDSAADRELMRNVLACAIYGETWQKDIVTEAEYSHYTPVLPELPEGVENIANLESLLLQNTTWKIDRRKKNTRGVIYVPTWDIFWDMESDDVQNGAGVLHRQMVSPFWLRQKKMERYFIDSAIESVLGNVRSAAHNKVVETTSSLAPRLRDVEFRQNTIVYKEFWGRLPRDVVEAYELQQAQEDARKGKKTKLPVDEFEQGDEIEVLVCIADSEVVRFTRRQPGKRPFRRCVWEDNMDGIGGIGVADNAEDMQLAINGAMRAFEDNKKLSSNLVGGVKPEFFEEDVKSVKPGLLFHLTPECENVNQGLMFAQIPDVGETLISMIHLTQQYADMNTMIPKVQQGIETKEKLTAFEISQLIEKAGKYLGAVIRNFDEMLIEPMIQEFYRYNMEDSGVNRGKGDYLIKALGFTSFQNKVERITKMQQMLTLALSTPELAAETNVRWYLEELLTALDIDVKQALKSDEQKQREAEQQQPNQQEMLMMQAQQANIARTQAQAQLAASKAMTTEEQLAIDRAKAVSEIQNKREKMELDAAKIVTSEMGL